MFELLKEIWTTSSRNKLRITLTGLAVAWGIFMLIFLLGAGNGLINAQMKQMDNFLTNSMMVFGGWTSKPHNGLKKGRQVRLDNRDLHTTAHQFSDNVDLVGGIVSHGPVTISYGQQYVASQELSGVHPASKEINKREMLYGRFINDIDIRERRKVLVISKQQAKELCKNDYRNLIGKSVRVGNIAFQVIGIYKGNEDEQNTEAFGAFTTVSTIYGRGVNVDRIEFSFDGLNTEAQNDAFEREYRRHLNANHDAAPDDESSVWLWNRFTQNLQMGQGIALIRSALWIVGLFILLSGIVGVSNIMLITVKERTREFGIRKALGATPWSILRLIIVESVIITTIFGYVGMFLGVLANEYMDATIGRSQIDTGLFKATMFLNPTVGIDTCIEATLVIIVAGTLAGLVPAYKAARVRPIEALNARN